MVIVCIERTAQLVCVACCWGSGATQHATWPHALPRADLQCPPLPLLNLRPPGLECCSIHVPECGGSPCQLALQPCPCPTCAVAADGTCTAFWGGLRSLRVQAAGATLQVDSRLLRLLRRCTRLSLEAGCASRSSEGPGAALPEATAAGPEAGPDLQPWLAALAPVFAATALQAVQLQAACAVLRPPSQPTGSWVLQAGDALAAGEGPQLRAASLPRGGSWQERSAGLVAQLICSREDDVFQLQVWNLARSILSC